MNRLPSFHRLTLPSWKCATGLLLVAAAVLLFLTVDDYGASWDQQVRAEAGQQKLDYYRHLIAGNHTEAAGLRNPNDSYPGFFDLNLALLKSVSPLSDFLTTKAFSALLGFLTLLAAAGLARRIFNWETACWTVLLLLLYPRFYGHFAINPKDVPFAFGYTVALLAFLPWLRPQPPRLPTAALTGLAFGICMASRVGGLVLFPYLLSFLALKILLRSAFIPQPLRHPRPQPLPKALAYLPALALTTVIAFAVLFLYLPALHTNPFASTASSLATVTHYGWDMPVFFNGQILKADELPRHYILWFFLITAPVPFLLLFLAFLFQTAHRISHRCRQTKPFPTGALLPRLLLAFAVLFPLAYVIIRDSTLYNGTRHLLFVIPPAAVCAAATLTAARKALFLHRPRLRLPAAFAAAACGLLVLIPMIRLHPYQYIYYNEIAGGTARAALRYETDYWGTSYRELARRFSQTVAAHPNAFPRPHIIINLEHVPHLFQPFLQPPQGFRFHVTRSNPRQDHFYAANTLWFAHTFYAGPPLLTVSRMHVPLAVLRDRRNLTPDQRAMGTFPVQTLPFP